MRVALSVLGLVDSSIAAQVLELVDCQPLQSTASTTEAEEPTAVEDSGFTVMVSGGCPAKGGIGKEERRVALRLVASPRSEITVLDGALLPAEVAVNVETGD